LYAGPISWKTLRVFSTASTRLLYPVWFFIRYLSIAFLFIFDALLSITHNAVMSIILLSLCVKLLIAPLYRIAARWQSDVNQQQSQLAPRLSEIKRQYKGEEQVQKTLALYKELHIHPLFALKSLLSAAIQIPVFFAAYHMLSEHIALYGVSLGIIRNLAYPDQLISLPFTIPFFGQYIHILPFVMTGISIGTAYIHTDLSLSKILQHKQRNSLLILALLFLIILYNSPAGMLLYWTINNIFSFMETLALSLFLSKNRTTHSLKDF
jgi:YidC/Oxa1 family membrane protein insertase